MRASLIWIMAIASGATVANLYYNQPLLALIGQQFHAPAQQVGFIPMLTQIGYAAGILLFVPLGDLVERRRLIVILTGCTALALALAAVSPNLVWLVAASFAIGMAAVSAQVLVPFAAQLTAPESRGRAVGRVMSGLFIGILLARTVSGYVGAVLSWQAIYWLASGCMIVMAVVLARALPKSQSNLKVSYLGLMASLRQIVQQPSLQTASLVGAMSFGAFSAFWSTLAFLLEQPPYGFGSDIVGLFGLVGVTGALAAPVVGKIADRRSPRFTVRLGLLTTTAAFLLFWLAGASLFALIIGVILLDLGVQTTQISNQASIYQLSSDLHSRLNAIYITFYFIGGAIGSYLGSYGWSQWQWNGVCGLSFLMLAIGYMGLLRGSKI